MCDRGGKLCEILFYDRVLTFIASLKITRLVRNVVSKKQCVYPLCRNDWCKGPWTNIWKTNC